MRANVCGAAPTCSHCGAPFAAHPIKMWLACALFVGAAIVAAAPDYVLLERDEPSLVYGDWLYVGDERARVDGATHIVSAVASKQRADDGVALLHVPFDDVPEQLLDNVFALTTPFLEEARRQHGRVLVHCRAGVSRSVSIVLAYLISAERKPYDEAIALVRAARPRAQPNVGFERQLRALEGMGGLVVDEV